MSVCPINRNSCFDPNEDVPQLAYCQPTSEDALLILGAIFTPFAFIAEAAAAATAAGLSNADYTINRFCNSAIPVPSSAENLSRGQLFSAAKVR